MKYQLIHEASIWSPTAEPDITRGTLEGDIAAGDITFYRLQCDSGQRSLQRLHRAGRDADCGHPSPSAASACSLSRRWTASTAMC